MTRTSQLAAACCLMALFCSPLAGAYSNLIAAADGSAVYFEAQTGFRGTRWYRAHQEAGRTVLREIDPGLADASNDDMTLAASPYGERFCSFGGSSCFTSSPCRASFSIDGPAGHADGEGRRTFLRLSRNGRRAWFEQTTLCRGLGGFPAAAEYQGLYEIPGLRRVFPPAGMTMACRRTGRRLVTDGEQVLVFGANRQLHFLGETGAQQVRHQYGASEAVTDAAGRNVVYTDGSPGRIRWIDLARQTEEDLSGSAVLGAAPALSDDGRLLAFLSDGGRLTLYSRASGQMSILDPAIEFVLTADGSTLFAVTPENRLLRIDTATGRSQTWLEPFPEIRDASTALDRDPEACPLICYTPQEPLVQLGRGSLLALGGHYLQPGWSVKLGDTEIPLQLLSNETAWFQVPRLAPEERQPLVVSQAGHPIRFSVMAQVSERFVSCLGTLHQEFDRIVSAQDPAITGEIVHVFLTGLEGVEAVPDMVPNPADRLVRVASPPPLGGDGALEPLFFGLAPGFIGLQQLDLRILRPVPAGEQLFPDTPSAPNCEIPPTIP